MASLSSFPILLLLLLLSPAESRPTASDNQPNSREALEIIIGPNPPETPEYPPSCPPPPPPPCPPPPPEFENERLKKAYFVIQRLKNKIRSGRLDVVKTWVGKDVCRYKGFQCDPLPVEKERSISAVSFNGFKFGGPELCLEGFMDELDDIAVFHANSNFFRGPIPKKINRQRFFYELDLSNNKLPGS